MFSAFNVYESFTLENADIEVTNARYCVHEDVPTIDEHPWQYTAKYINCVMKHNGNTLQYNGTACIGAGTNRNSTSIIEGGKYTSVQFGAAIGYHNFNTASWGDLPSRVILRNVWLNNSLRLSTMSTSKMDV